MGARRHATAGVDADDADLRMHTEQKQRRPAKRRGLIRAPVREVDALAVDGHPVRTRKARTGRHAGSEVEEAMAPDLGVGGDDRDGG